MLSFLILILFVIGLFKLTGVILHIAGKILGGLLGIIGWVILGTLAVTLFGLALYALPVVLVIGLIALIIAAAS
ncbi:MAG: hypothetical protein LKG40_05790 [Lachnospiraceae bacterium]|jgi:hypothetical protein|nr:hypothetical protein [Lachnospiraceae bacterium]MCI1328383.1 hypothetical protein [Lachnospiraceae bacterium]